MNRITYFSAAPKEQIRTFAEPSKAAINQWLDVIRGQRRSVLQVAFDISMAIFFGIEFRCIGRQPFDANQWLGCEIGFDAPVAMNARAVPDEDATFGYVTLQMFERRNNIKAVEGTLDMMLVDFAG